MILRATWLLATMRHWMNLDAVATSDFEAGSETLSELGFGDFARWMRAQLAERIDQEAPHVPGIGRAITEYVHAWRSAQLVSAYDTRGGHSTRAFLAARDTYIALHSGSHRE
jgi:hypothetical protein